MAFIARYNVAGMSCEHCVNAVTAEVRKVPGVTEVHVDLDGGSVEVESDHSLNRADVAAAVDEAGYELVP